MKLAGFGLITVGFLAGSLVVVLHVENIVDWYYFIPALLLGFAGVALARVAARQTARAGETLATNIGNLNKSIDRIVSKITTLDAQKTNMNPYDVHPRIDQLFVDDLNTFVEARESIGHVYGLQAYAEVMNEFAAGERYLNRVWSASADGYIDEVHQYLSLAKEQFVISRKKLRELKATRG